MTVLRRGDEVREVYSNYAINSLKAQGFVDEKDAKPAPREEPKKNKRKKRGGKKS